MRMRVAGVVALAVMCAAVAPADKKPKYGGLAMQPKQIAALEQLPQVVAAQPCENWAWAAGMEELLRRRGVALDQRFWVIRTYGGEVCRERGPLPELERSVNNNFATADGRKVALTFLFRAGPPVAETVIRAMKEQTPFLMLWRGRVYVPISVLYDEYIAVNGSRLFEVRELKLMDLSRALDHELRTVTFENGRNDPAEIDGIMDVEVKEREAGRF